MPQTIALGVKYDEFWSLNPRKINVMVKAYNKQVANEMRKENMLCHLQGMYFAEALIATVGNMFRGKGQKAHEYPKEPYTMNFEYEEGLNIEVDEERDIARRRLQFVTGLNNLFRSIEVNKDAEH